MEKLVEIFPNPLNLTPTKNTPYIESKLNIKNLTDNYVILKVFNSNTTIYSAKPSKSFIPPKERKDVYIKRFSKEETLAKKDQFLFIFYSIDKIINNNDEVKEAFNSKIYNESSEQKIIISVIINNENKDNKNDSENIYDDDKNEIKIYKDLIENMKKEYDETNKNIIKLEKLYEALKNQNKLLEDKRKAELSKKKNPLNSFNQTYKNIILISIILLGLIFGANLACKYNKLFVYKPRIIKQIIIKQR